MSEFINRFLNIRYVVKNVWTQIDELNPVLSKQAVSLGKKHDESLSRFLARSRNPDTDTVGFEHGDYMDQVNALFGMITIVGDTLEEIRSIYCDLLEILQIDITNDFMERIDDPDDDIMEILDPKVDLDGLDKAMYMDMGLVYIANRIRDVMFRKGGFHIHERNAMWQVLRQNRLSVLEAEHVAQWPESPPEDDELDLSKHNELVHKISTEVIAIVNERSDATLKRAANAAAGVRLMRREREERVRKDKLETLEKAWRHARAAADHQYNKDRGFYSGPMGQSIYDAALEALAKWREFTGRERAIPRANDWTMYVRDDYYDIGDYRRNFTSRDEQDANDTKRSAAYKAWAKLMNRKIPDTTTDAQLKIYMAEEAVALKMWNMLKDGTTRADEK
jgi:dsDNA-binding SOS-regulon protein